MNDIKFINLNNNVDLNDITNRGIYEIKGYANQNTSLPIGHLTEEYVNGLLIVLDNSNTSKNVSITQFLILSSTLKNIYIRKGVGDINNIVWDSWIKELNNGTIDDLTNISDRINNNVENIDELFKRLQGISEYTNPLTDPFEFLGEFADISELINFLDDFKQNKGEFRALVNNNLITINSNYFGGITSQIIKGCIVLNEDNTIKFSGFYNEYCRFYFGKWMNWDIINKQDIIKLINSEIETLLEGTDPEKIDSIKDLINWVNEHGKDAAEMLSAIQANTTAINNEKDRAISAETILDDEIRNINNNGISVLNRTIINYNTRYNIAGAVTKQQVIEDLLNKYTADKGTIVTYYAEDGWHTIQYKLNYYRPEQAKDESNWVEIVNEDTIKDIKDSIDNAYVKPEGGIPKNDLSTEVQEAIDNIGKVADGSVTENKLSPNVKDKLNTAYYKATLADSMRVNDGINFVIGALENTGEIYQGTNFRATSMPILTNGEKITVSGGYIITKYVLYYDNEAADYSSVDAISLNTFDGAGVENVHIRIEVRKTDNTAISEDELTGIVKSFIRKPIVWYDNCNLDYFTPQGRYAISGERQSNATDNMPIINGGKVEAVLDVLAKDNCVTQVLTLLNVGGGDGNIYTRTRQNNTWSAWGKLQTNIEVGVIDQQQMDALVDNGIYSGILSTTKETFVIICINNYAIAQQVGVHHISQLKYSLVVGTAEVKIEKRTRDAYGFWTDWQGIGGGDTSVVNQTSTTATIAPNVMNVWGEVSSLDITLAEADATKVNEYMFQFTSGATATTLVLPADIKWVSAPNVQVNKTYQVSIINNLGVIGEFSHE